MQCLSGSSTPSTYMLCTCTIYVHMPFSGLHSNTPLPPSRHFLYCSTHFCQLTNMSLIGMNFFNVYCLLLLSLNLGNFKPFLNPAPFNPFIKFSCPGSLGLCLFSASLLPFCASLQPLAPFSCPSQPLSAILCLFNALLRPPPRVVSVITTPRNYA